MEERNNRNDSLRNRSSRKRRRASSAGNIDKVLGLFQNKYAIVVVVVVVLIALVLGLSFCGKDTVEDETTISGEDMVETTEEVATSNSYELQKDAIPQVNELINTYFTVMKNADVEGYMNIVSGDQMTQDKLTKKGEFIEDYRNITCYTKPGLTDGDHVAYVYYEVKFRNIDTLAPAMIRLYICGNDDGTMYIHAGDLDAELSGYINTISNDEALRLLEDQTNQSLSDACAADEKLAALYKMLIEGGVQPTEPETTQEPETDINEMVFETRDEKVYAITAVRVRSTPTTDTNDNILGKIEAGDELKRIGYNDTWSKVEYKGHEAYVYSEYVITK